MAVKEEEPTKLQKRNPEIIEDASFYQDLTYVAIMKDIEKASNKKQSALYVDYHIGSKMKIYLEKKGFTVINLIWTYDYQNKHKIEW